MRLIEKLQSPIILAAVFVGLALGGIPGLAEPAGRLILPLLMLMLTGAFLHVPLRRFGDVLNHRRVAFASLAVNFVWTPLLAWLLGWLFLRDAPALWIGLIMLLVTPCTDWYLVFTGIARGNLALSTALLPVNLTLQLVLLPVYLLLLAGTVISLDAWRIVESVALVLLLPLSAAIALRAVAVRVRGEGWLAGKVLPVVQLGQILFLALAIAAMFASQGNVIVQNPQAFLRLLAPLMLFYAINMALALVVGRAMRAPYPDVASLCCTTLARNSPIALGIALAAFPEQPLIALTLVIGPLIELPVLGVASQMLLWIRRAGAFPSPAPRIEASSEVCVAD
ncbi:MAG: arsenic resistance protein [Anaerolineae bacterium]|nr:arsenic resistance protein [Candidatus Roseilinea sp.]MDW8448539.1 arsenic resistance protein [Anaerolineae bacterium]